MRLIVILPPGKEKAIGKYQLHKYRIFPKDAQALGLPARDGAADADDEIQIICDFSMLPAQTGKRAVRALERIEAALRGADKDFLATEPDREAEAIAWHVLTCLREGDSIGKGPVRAIALREVTPDTGEEKDGPAGRNSDGRAAGSRKAATRATGAGRRHLNTEQAAVYLGFSPKSLTRWRPTGQGPEFSQVGRRILYNIEDLDKWVKKHKRRFSGEDEGES